MQKTILEFKETLSYISKIKVKTIVLFIERILITKKLIVQTSILSFLKKNFVPALKIKLLN